MISSRKYLCASILFVIPITAALMFPFAGGAAPEGQKQTQSQSGSVRKLPNYDALGASVKRSAAAAAQSSLQDQAPPQSEGGHLVQIEPRLAVPTFLWASESDRGPRISQHTVAGQAGQKAGGLESMARDHLSKYASRYRLSAEDIANAPLTSVHDTGKGPIIVKFKREVGGVEVFRDEVAIVMDRDMQLIAISGYITGGDDSAVPAFSLQSTAAITKALTDLTGSTINQSTLKRTTKVAGPAGNPDSYQYFTAGKDQTPGFVLDDLVRAKQVMYHLVDQYIPSYYIETNVLIPVPDSMRVDLSGNPQTDWVTEAYSYVISAVDGQILFRKNLAQRDVYTYRVFADPTTKIPYDSPAGNAVVPKIVAGADGVQYPFLSPNDITLQNYPFSRNDPWLPPGATETIGNNVDAYVDLFNPDGLNPAGLPSDPATADFRAQITGPGQFLHTHTPDADPKLAEARQGTIQQLFYNVNFLHDWYYEAGFDEASGNAQASNYGRGGAENDRLRAEAQDVSSRNTSNMITPADGTSPRMQMFLFDPNEITYFEVLSPEAAAGQRGVGTGQFGPQSFDITNEVVQPNPAGGCTAASLAGAAGKFVMVDRQPTSGTGSCSISTKLNNAMAAGAAGFILVNLSTTPNDAVSVSGSLPTFTIPFLSVSWNAAASIKTELAAANTVSARMRRDFAFDRDSGIDNQAVFHEWGHYLSNRLVGNSAGLVSPQAQGMGEGWGDFNALLLTVRQDDAAVASNANFNGTYALSTYVSSGGNNNGYYFGNRRYPYSTDLTRNPLTLKHIVAGEALPVGPPRNFSSAISASNAEVHNTGEVWATMLWECYASLLRDTQGLSPRLTFQEAQTRMKYYLVAALKTTPNAPTLLDGRDALLAAAYATDQVDYQHFWAAFAKRGAGFGAVIADRFSLDNSGVTESFNVASDASFTGASLDDGVTSCDQDGIIDSGERGHLTLNLRNIGLNTLTGTTGTVTSSTPGVTLSNGGNVTFASYNPGSSASASIDVTLATGIAGVQSLDFQLTYNDPQFASPHTVSFSFRGNTNSIPASTATDAVETGTNGWTVTSVPPTQVTGGVTLVIGVASPFRINEVSSLQHVWHVDDVGALTDERLTSPVFTVDGGGSFNLQFDHSWGFEFDAGANYDGGVVEMSVNGGAFFDIGAAAYNGTIFNGGSSNPNPLRGRTGFVKNSGGTIHTSLTQAVAPGSTVQVRFREGSDFAIGGTGWDIDNISFIGVVETPFSTLVADQSSCPGPSPTPVTLQLTPNTLPAGAVTLAYPTTVLTASGGSAPYIYSLTPFGLPPGLVRDVVDGNLQISGTPTLPGTYPLTIVVNDSAGHQKSFNYSISINRLDPNVVWNNPLDITFGTALGDTQLNATAGVPGMFTYTPTAGTALNAGNSQTLSVQFVPTDTNYSSITKSVTINVLKATPNITWSNPQDITYGTAIGGTQLNASASVPGVLTYNPPSGTVLSAGHAQLLSVNFVPTDTTNYNDTAKNVLINVVKATPDITWSHPEDIVYGTALSATQLNASASVPGTLTYTPAATMVLNAGNAQRLSVGFVPTDTANYNNHSKDVPINVTKASQTISFGALSAKTFGDADFNVSATSSSNLTVSLAATGSCTVSGNTVHLTGAGSCTITASQGGNVNYNSAANVAQTFAVNKTNQTIIFGALSAKTFGDADFNVSATASSNLTVSFAATGSCTVSGNTVHLTGAGSCTITASQGGNVNYNSAANVAQTFAVNKTNQTITFGALSAKTFGDADFNVSATASSNLTVSFAATGSCTISGNTVHLTGAGSCTITASQGGNGNYNSAANVAQTFAVNKTNQTITFGALLAKTLGDADFSVSATASSNLTVSFAATGSCTISGNTVHLSGAGSCTITASQGGNSNYHSAANVAQTFAVNKTNQTITFGALLAKTLGDADFSVSATASSNLTVSFAATGRCTISGNTIHLSGAGSCTITASQGGNSNYHSAANVAQTFAVNKANQSIMFSALLAKTFGDADFNVSATASSNLTVSFAATGSCTISSNTVHLSGAGLCTITASQGGNSNYNSAANVAQTFAVAMADQTITFAALLVKTFGDADFNVSAIASSNLTVSFAATGSCTVIGNTVHLTAAGLCTITASQGGNGNYNSAANVGRTFAIDKANQTIAFGLLSTKTYADADFNVSATASSDLAVSFAATGSCTVSGNTVHLTGAGSCTITASQSGDIKYNSAANVARTFAVEKANQTITFVALLVKTFGDADFNVSATASSDLAVSFAAIGSCTVIGNTIHLTGAGSCTITASQSGDNNYNSAANVSRTFAVEKANQTITFAALLVKTFGDADFNVSATASSDLAVSFAAIGSCTVIGNTIHLTGAGSCTITASQSGDNNYNSAANVSRTFAVEKADQTITFAALLVKTFGDADFNISAQTSSNLTVSVAATGNCTVGGNTVHLTGAGLCTITASQAGNSDYNAATSVTRTFAIGKADQQISFPALPNRKFGDADFNVSATASSNLTVSFSASGNCTIAGAQVHIVGAGSCTITTSQGGDSNYNPAHDVSQTFGISEVVNGAPDAVDDTLKGIAEDSGVRTIAIASLLANDTSGQGDETGQTLSFSLVASSEVGGTVTTDGTNVYFTPAANFNGLARFQYRVTDNGTTNGAPDPKSDMATASFTITEVNDAPAASNDELETVTEDSGERVIQFSTLMNNDSKGPADENGQTLTVTAVSNPVGGSVNIVAGTVRFSPAANYNGLATFQYTIEDNGATNGAPDPASANATVSFNITEVNDEPTSNAETLAPAHEDVGLITIPFVALTENDSKGPANESGQTLVVKSVSNAVGGTVSIVDGNVLFTTTDNYNGTASFDYTIEDNGTSNGAADPRTSGTATASFNLISLADTPLVTNTSTNANTQTTSGLVISHNPADGPEVTHFRITGITGGSLFKLNGVTPIRDHDFISFSEGNAGLKFTPGTLSGSFMVQSSTSASEAGLHGGVATATITINSLGGVIIFSAANYRIAEGAGARTITVERTGDTRLPITVDYVSSDHSTAEAFLPCTSPGVGFASSRCDFTTATGRLRFAAGETSKAFNLLINQDNYVEGPETLELTLFNPTAGAELGTPATATVEITDEATEGETNPIDNAADFVISQYHDVLNRDPDAPGLAFWTDNIEKCNDEARRPTGLSVAQCVDKQRESTAIAFFMSPEFQMTGGFVYRLYKGSLPGFPNYDGSGRFPTARQFMRDVSQVSEGIVVNNRIDGAVVEANRNLLAEDFVERPEFDAKYGGLNNALYVEELLNTTGINQQQVNSGGEHSLVELKQELVEGLNRGTETRASVLRKIVDGTVVISEDQVRFTTPYGQAFYEQEYRRMFVYMEYVGYLRRNPDAAGFIHWLGKLNQFNGDPFGAEMVRSFILSPEYRSRFGQP